MIDQDMKVCRIDDPRLVTYENRLRDGVTQVFYTGDDRRDFDRHRKEGGGCGQNIEMHDKPDTIRLTPPEKHFYAGKIDGEWWWLNGCSVCNGRERDSIASYIECEEHNVCVCCGISRKDAKGGSVWGGSKGWTCNSCEETTRETRKQEKLEAFAEADYDESDFTCQDEVVCPHCAHSYYPDSPESGDECCPICDGEFHLEVEFLPIFTTTVIGDREKAA